MLQGLPPVVGPGPRLVVLGSFPGAASLQAGAQKASVRVRIAGEQAALNLKSRELGASRQEFEYAIPPRDAVALMPLAPAGLTKWRHGLDLPGGDWVLDVFEGANAPLVLAVRCHKTTNRMNRTHN